MQPARRFDWQNLRKRLLSALILMPLGVASVALGGPYLLVVLAVAVALLAIEWGVMSAPKAPVRIAAVITAAVLAAMFTGYLGHFRIAWFVGLGCAVSAAFVARGLAARAVDAAFGVIYIGAPMLALMWLRERSPGMPWAFLVLTVAWAADSFAFMVGSVLKGPKLWPRFSPNKTWSGFFGGLAAAIAMVLILHRLLPQWFDTGMPLPLVAAVGLAGGLATMGGDLLESMLKRRFGVKDSGDLIPGHGGLLDRVDGLMFAIMAVAVVRLAGRLGAGV